MKAKVFKMGNAWIWECKNDHGVAGVGDVFSAERWTAPWACAYARAVDHVDRYHSNDPGEDQDEIEEE